MTLAAARSSFTSQIPLSVYFLEQSKNGTSLDHCKVTVVDEPASYRQLLGDTVPVGEAYWQAVYHHARNITTAAFNRAAFSRATRIGIIDVPRGGVPVGHSIADALADANDIEIIHRSSNIKDSPDRLYPDDFSFDQLDMLVLGDGIIATGKTILDHIRQIPADWKGQLMIVCNATAELGLRNINELAKERGLKTSMVTGRIYDDSECSWVNLGGKQVYFVGGDDGIPDVGDKITGIAP